MDFKDLLPTAEELATEKREGFECSTLRRLIKDLSAPKDVIRRSREQRYTLPMFFADFPRLNWDIAIERIDSYSVNELFERPTKSPVWRRFHEVHPAHADEDCYLFFKAAGFGTMIMGSGTLLSRCAVVLKAEIRGRVLWVTKYEEFIDVVRDSRILEA